MTKKPSPGPKRPETAGALIRQRFRWTFGTLQSFWKHSDTLFRPKHGTLGWIALPNIFVFQLVLPLISPVIDLMFFGSLLLWGLAQFRVTKLPQLWTTADVEKSVIFFLGFLADRRPHLRSRVCPREKGRLDAARPRPPPALLLSPVDVCRPVPLGEGSRQRPPGGLARRRNRSSAATFDRARSAQLDCARRLLPVRAAVLHPC